MRDTTFAGADIFSGFFLQVPRQCSLVLLVKVLLRESEALESEKGKG
jgi:hypothetical protein